MKKPNSQCGRRGERIFSNLCVLPSLAGVLIFFLIPFCIVIYYSVINNPISAQFVGLENFRRLFKILASEDIIKVGGWRRCSSAISHTRA